MSDGAPRPPPRPGPLLTAAGPDTRQWFFPAMVVGWVDADTFDADVDLGFFAHMHRLRFRLLGSEGGVDGYEMRDADPVKRAKAVLGKARAIELAPPGSRALVVSEKDNGAILPDNFGRWLGQLITPADENVGDVLLAEELAVPWHR